MVDGDASLGLTFVLEDTSFLLTTDLNEPARLMYCLAWLVSGP